MEVKGRPEERTQGLREVQRLRYGIIWYASKLVCSYTALHGGERDEMKSKAVGLSAHAQAL